MSTIADFIVRQRLIIDKLVNENKPLRIASQTAHTRACRRIFDESLDSNGSPITWKHGGKRRKAYSKNYADYVRLRRERQIERVDFTLDGDFRSDYVNTEGSKPTPVFVTPQEYVVGFRRSKDRKTHAELAEIFENDFYEAPIFTLSEDEKQLFYETAELELAKALEE